MRKREAESIKRQNAALKEQVAAQEVQVDDVKRMMGEKRSKEETLRGLREELQEANNAAWKKEVDMSRHISALEKGAQEFNTLAER